MVLIHPEQPDPETVVVPWVNRLAAECDLAKSSAEWLARRLGRPADSLIGSLRAMTTYERTMFLESALPMVSETGVELVGRWLIENTEELAGISRARARFWTCSWRGAAVLISASSRHWATWFTRSACRSWFSLQPARTWMGCKGLRGYWPSWRRPSLSRR